MLKFFLYTGYDKHGNFKLGVEKNLNYKNVKVDLKKRNILIKKIYTLPFLRKKENLKSIQIFFAQMKIFIKNGYSFNKTFELLEENKNLKKYIRQMRKGLERGDSLYNILKDSGLPLKINDLIIIKTYEESGNIYKAFDIIENKIKEKSETKKEIKKIMIYPVIIISIILILIFFMGRYILPDFIKISQDNCISLPFITRFILFFSNHFFIILLSIFLLMFFLLKFIKKTKINKMIFDFGIKIKFIKNIINNIFIKNFTNNLTELVSSGITITDGIELIKKEMIYSYFENKLQAIQISLKRGETIYSALKKINIFSKVDLELIKFGEETGELEKTFSAISKNKKNEIREKIIIFNKIIEPVSIIIVGILVCIIFLAIYLPIFQIMDEI